MNKKKVLLTGGSRGIGAAALKLLGRDYDVFAPSRSELDLADPLSVNRYLQSSREFDVLINNAGVNIVKPLNEISANDIRLVNQINLESPLLLMQGVIPFMEKQKFGRIINLSSIWGIRSKTYRTLYSGAKWGLIGYTKALAREFACKNILINAVCPGFTNTELTESTLSHDERVQIKQEIPLGRFANTNEIAALIEFLISEKNTYITGQAYLIDGGFLA